MLEGPARIWLNNLPEGSVNGRVGFRKMFISNFSSTYKRPNRPQVLMDCKQMQHETDREYLTRWCTIRNTCEGVEERQAIGWFTVGAGMAPCCGRSTDELRQEVWPRQLRSPIHMPMQIQPCRCQQQDRIESIRCTMQQEALSSLINNTSSSGGRKNADTTPILLEQFRTHPK